MYKTIITCVKNINKLLRRTTNCENLSKIGQYVQELSIFKVMIRRSWACDIMQDNLPFILYKTVEKLIYVKCRIRVHHSSLQNTCTSSIDIGMRY